MKKHFLLACLLLFTVFSAFAGRFDIFAAVPLVISDSYEQTPQSMAAGGGIAFSSLDAGETFGVILGIAAFHHLLAEQLPFTVIDSGPLPDSMTPWGVDFILGCTVPFINTKCVTFPVTIAFHTRAAFLDRATQMDIGIAGQGGLTFWGKKQKAAFFIRANVYLDFSRFLLSYDGPSFERSALLNAFGVVPEIGLSIPLGKQKKAASPRQDLDTSLLPEEEPVVPEETPYSPAN
ncbi:MAG: hypothetical protein LBS97_01785 [Treponema sp.]|jgi:hypothetical protein|nr:hypothetical protein [Treponema sp.]